jgi:hypothetical protein
MRLALCVAPLAFFLAILAGCGTRATDPSRAANSQDADAEYRANLAQLPAEDRKLAEAQKFCAVQTKHRLGSMGAPVKVMVQGQPVFLCCEGCEGKARADPAKTLAKVEELKAQSGGSGAK